MLKLTAGIIPLTVNNSASKIPIKANANEGYGTFSVLSFVGSSVCITGANNSTAQKKKTLLN